MNPSRSIDQLSYGDQGLKPKDDDQPNVGVGGQGANWEVANTMKLWRSLRDMNLILFPLPLWLELIVDCIHFEFVYILFCHLSFNAHWWSQVQLN